MRKKQAWDSVLNSGSCAALLAAFPLLLPRRHPVPRGYTDHRNSAASGNEDRPKPPPRSPCTVSFLNQIMGDFKEMKKLSSQ